MHKTLSGIALLLLASCGGGGGGGSPALTQTPASTPIAPQSSSYLNFKNIGLLPQELPGNIGGNGTTARAYADYFRSGNLDLFTASLTYHPPASATVARLQFWKKLADGGYIEDSTSLVINTASRATQACIHPRKAIVADFNKDGTPDIFIACHGYDAGSFPGETNKVVLSRSDGKFTVNDASPDIAFWHGAAALDVNGDGAIDVIAVDGGNTITTFINNGAGQFTKEATPRFPTFVNGGYYTIEAVDINGDGALDILTGGHESAASPTYALINPGNHQFRQVTPTALPPVNGFGVVLDFVVTSAGAKPTVWALRTGDGNNFYVGKMIQKIDWNSLTGSIALQGSGNWLPWIIPTVVDGRNFIAPDTSSTGFSVAY